MRERVRERERGGRERGERELSLTNTIHYKSAIIPRTCYSIMSSVILPLRILMLRKAMCIHFSGGLSPDYSILFLIN